MVVIDAGSCAWMALSIIPRIYCMGCMSGDQGRQIICGNYPEYSSNLSRNNTYCFHYTLKYSIIIIRVSKVREELKIVPEQQNRRTISSELILWPANSIRTRRIIANRYRNITNFQNELLTSLNQSLVRFAVHLHSTIRSKQLEPHRICLRQAREKDC